MKKRGVISFFSIRPRSATLHFIATASVIIIALLTHISLTSADPSGDWLEEFEDVCSKVRIGDSLELQDLKSLIERVDKLIPLIQASDHKSKKVYIFRLKKCRSFFEYIIELKKSGRS